MLVGVDDECLRVGAFGLWRNWHAETGVELDVLSSYSSVRGSCGGILRLREVAAITTSWQAGAAQRCGTICGQAVMPGRAWAREFGLSWRLAASVLETACAWRLRLGFRPS